MTKGSNMSVEPIHSFSAVLKGAFILILFACSMLSYAQTFSSTSSYRVDAKVAPASEQTQRYSSYQSTVYEPFTDALPSSASSTTDEQFVITERKNGFLDRPDTGQGESPVGEPWILLLFAAAAAIVVAWRRRKVA